MGMTLKQLNKASFLYAVENLLDSMTKEEYVRCCAQVHTLKGRLGVTRAMIRAANERIKNHTFNLDRVSNLKLLANHIRKEYPNYVSGDDDFSTRESTRQSLIYVIDRMVEDEDGIVKF